MTPDLPQLVNLGPRGLFEIDAHRDVEIRCRTGCVWVTLDNDPRDIVLAAGERFVAPAHRRAIVYAFEASMLNLAHAAEPVQYAPSRPPRTTAQVAV